jgi:hypothetical protein
LNQTSHSTLNNLSVLSDSSSLVIHVQIVQKDVISAQMLIPVLQSYALTLNVHCVIMLQKDLHVMIVQEMEEPSF